MKKIFIIGLMFTFFGCNSKDDKVTDDSKTKNEVGVQNDTGGIPDTTNAINLSTHKKDTVQKLKDSVK